MSLLSIIMMLFTFVSGLFLSILVLVKNNRSSSNVIFGIMCFFAGLWGLCLAINLMLPNNYYLALYFNRLCNFAAMYVAILWLHFVYSFINVSKEKRFILITGYILCTFIAFITILTDWSIAGLTQKFHFKNYAFAGPFYPANFIVFSVLIIFGFISLWKAYYKYTGLKKLQIKYILISAVISFPIGATTYVPVFNINFYPIGMYFTWAYVPLVAYAILKYRLMDIEIIVKKSFIYSSIIIMATTVYGLIIFSGQLFFREYYNYEIYEWVSIVIASIIVAIGGVKLKEYFDLKTDQIFFKGKYNYQKTLNNVSRAITSIIDLNQLISLLDKTLKETVKVKKVSLLLLDENIDGYIEKININGELAQGKIINSKSELAKYAYEKKEPIVEEEISYRLSHKELQPEAKILLTEVKKDLDKGRWALSLPLISKDKLTGLLNLGPKLSGDVYSNTDLDLLTIMANQTAVAVENSSIYQREKEISQIKSDFISIASHKFRTPLSVVKWALQILKEDSNKLSRDQKELLDKSIQSNNAMIKLVNNLLNVSRIEENKFGFNFIPTKIEDLISSIIKDLYPEIEKRKVELIFEKGDNLLPELNIDQTMMKIVLENIITNAIYYSPNKKARVNISLSPNKKFILITVEDKGIGIPKNEQKRLFEKFYRSSNAIKLETEGTGLGLFISQRIVRRHGGEITFKSDEGKGSTFWIKLPIK